METHLYVSWNTFSKIMVKCREHMGVKRKATTQSQMWNLSDFKHQLFGTREPWEYVYKCVINHISSWYIGHLPSKCPEKSAYNFCGDKSESVHIMTWSSHAQWFQIKFISHKYKNDIYTNTACIYLWAVNQKSRGLSSWLPWFEDKYIEIHQ